MIFDRWPFLRKKGAASKWQRPKTIDDGGNEAGGGKKRNVQGPVPWLLDRWPRITVRECRKRPAGIPCVRATALRQTKANANYLHRFRRARAFSSPAFHVRLRSVTPIVRYAVSFTNDWIIRRERDAKMAPALLLQRIRFATADLTDSVCRSSWSVCSPIFRRVFDRIAATRLIEPFTLKMARATSAAMKNGGLVDVRAMSRTRENDTSASKVGTNFSSHRWNANIPKYLLH